MWLIYLNFSHGKGKVIEQLKTRNYPVLTLVEDRVGDDGLEGESESPLVVALQEHLKAEPDAVQVEPLGVVSVSEAS